MLIEERPRADDLHGAGEEAAIAQPRDVSVERLFGLAIGLGQRAAGGGVAQIVLHDHVGGLRVYADHEALALLAPICFEDRHDLRVRSALDRAHAPAAVHHAHVVELVAAPLGGPLVEQRLHVARAKKGEHLVA